MEEVLMKKLPKVLILPEDRKSSIDYLMIQAKEKPEILYGEIYLSPMCLQSMEKDEYLHFVSPNLWLGDEVVIKGEYFPELSYRLEEPNEKGYCRVIQINYSDTFYNLKNVSADSSFLVMRKSEFDEGNF